MRIFLKTLIYLFLLNIYWLNTARRVYLKKRLNKNLNSSIKTTAHNLSLMMYPDKNYKIKGRTEILKGGAILYSLHFGTWELMPEILQKALNKKTGILVNRYTDNNPLLIGKIMDKIFYLWRKRYNAEIFYPEEVFKIKKFIKEGGIFSVLVDGDGIYSKYEKIKRLASLCNAPLISFAVYYDRNNYVMEIGCDFDRLIAKRPYDYWWFYKSRRI